MNALRFSCIFLSFWVNLLFVCSSPVLIWSDRESKTLPQISFEKEDLIVLITKNNFSSLDLVLWSKQSRLLENQHNVHLAFIQNLCHSKSVFMKPNQISENILLSGKEDIPMILAKLNKGVFFHITLENNENCFELLDLLIMKMLDKLHNSHHFKLILMNQNEEHCTVNEHTKDPVIEVNRIARAIKDGNKGNSTSSPNGLFINGTCVYVYIENASLHINKQKIPRLVESIPLTNVGYHLLKVPECKDEKIQNLKINFTNLPSGLQELNLGLTFIRSSRNYWKLINSTTNVILKTPLNDIKANDVNLRMHCELGAYVNHSFVCDDMPWTEKNKPSDRNFLLLHFKKIQVQAFGIHNSSFSKRVNDCTGFFSPSLWMGLFSSGVMVSVLAFGLSVLLSTKSMDRFDNPKTANALNLGISHD